MDLTQHGLKLATPPPKCLYKRTDEQLVMGSYDGILHSTEKEWPTDAHNNTEESHRHVE